MSLGGERDAHVGDLAILIILRNIGDDSNSFACSRRSAIEHVIFAPDLLLDEIGIPYRIVSGNDQLFESQPFEFLDVD